MMDDEEAGFLEGVQEHRVGMIMASRVMRTFASIPGEEEATKEMALTIMGMIERMNPHVRMSVIMMLCQEVDDWKPSPPIKDPGGEEGDDVHG
jgi:hypothetical protein